MIVKRYFVDRDGVETGRAQGAPGGGHVEAARLLLPQLDAESEWYEPLFRLKFMRVAEDTEGVLHLDAPYAASLEALPNAQRRWVKDKQAAGFAPVLNNRAFVEARDVAGAVVGRLLD